MTTSIKAIYKRGVFEPVQHIHFPEQKKYYLLAIPEVEWKKEFLKLLKGFHKHSQKISSSEIEKDITLAFTELYKSKIK